MATRKSARRAITDAIIRWANDEFPPVMREVKRNLTGRMLRKRTGRTLRNVEQQSKVIRRPRGFRLATTSPSLIAWMTGAHRRGYIVRPKKAKALRFEVGGKTIFAKRAVIPPWQFHPKRPVFEDAVQRRQPRFTKQLEKRVVGATNEIFEGRRITVRVLV